VLSFLNNILIDENVSQDAYDVIRLTRSKAAVWTVDNVARWIDFSKKLFIYFYPQ